MPCFVDVGQSQENGKWAEFSELLPFAPYGAFYCATYHLSILRF